MSRRRHVATVSIPVIHNSSSFEELLNKLESVVRSTDIQNQNARAQCNANYMGMIEVKIDNVCKVTGGMLHQLEQAWEASQIESKLRHTTVNPSNKEGCSVLLLLADCTRDSSALANIKPKKSRSRCVFWVVLMLAVALLLFPCIAHFGPSDALNPGSNRGWNPGSVPGSNSGSNTQAAMDAAVVPAATSAVMPASNADHNVSTN